MTKSGTWPGGVAMESLSNMDSAGSCDSVISVNSGCSEDSMEHLSAEERACLMYLEETIEALDVEVQEDSGLSNDEPDAGHLAGKMDQTRAEDISSVESDESGRDQKSLPTPLAPSPAEPGSGALTDEDKAERQAQSQTSEPPSTAASSSINPTTQPKPPVAESVAGCEVSSATATESAQSTKASDIDLGLIPPPSDFMDEIGPPPPPEKRKHLPPLAATSNNRPAAEVPASLNPAAVASGPPVSPPSEAAEPRSPPAVAPKPKKLPANIVLKSHKAPVAGSDGNLVHMVPASSERQILDPQRVRIEALRKLGLLKSDDAESGPVLSPILSPKTPKSWASPPPPISPAAPHTPPSTPSYTHVNSTPPASVSVQPSTPAAPDILPAPVAFSDGRLSSDTKLSAVKDMLETTVNVSPAPVKSLTPPKKTGVKSATLERSGLGLSSFMSTQESNEASKGISREQSLSQLRQNRPRPASLGSRKEFSSGQGEGDPTSKDPDSGMSLPVHAAFQFSRDSQKLPRSQGISVLICPRAENGDNRREALKKLGLLRD